MRQFPLLLVGLLWTLNVYGQTTTIPLQPSALTVPAGNMDQFLAYSLYRLDHEPLYRLWESPGELIEFELQIEQDLLDFELYRYDQRAPNYSLISGARESRDAMLHSRLPAAQFKGLLTNDLASTSIFTIDDEYILGFWRWQNGEEYFLEPLWRFWPEAPRDVYVYYTADQVAPTEGHCATEDEFHPGDRPVASSRSSAGDCLEVELSIAGDFELFNDFGSVAATENFILNTLALVQTNYDSQNGDEEFDDELRFYVVNTYIANSNAADPWTNDTDAGTLLNSFRDWGEAGGFDNDYDVAALWTGRNLDGGTVGVAWLSAICGSLRYNVNENFTSNNSSLRVLWAHELGHNFGSSHDSGTGFIMSPSVNNTTTWSSQSRNAINNFYQGINCLDFCPNVPPAAGFSVTSNNICPGNSITFTNTSTGNIASYSWVFPGGSPGTSTEENPTVTYNNTGAYVATLTVTNAAGSNTSQQTIFVASNQTDIRVFESFENNGFGSIGVNNPDGSTSWTLRDATGNGGGQAAYMNNYSYNAPGQIDRLVLPIQDLSDVSNLRLEFEYAYVRYSTTFEDQLQVVVTTPDGSSVEFFGDEDGSGNFATGPMQTNFFVANDPSDWCFNGPQCVDLDLSQYDGQSNVQITIENINGYGNSMYVDNILLTAVCTPPNLPVEWLSFTAEPVEDHAVLEWSVNQDELHAGFVVERAHTQSPDRWESLGYVERKGTAGNNVDYNYYDYEVARGQAYLYRLRQRDIDGNESLSAIRSVSFGQFGQPASIYPNPSKGPVQLLTSARGGHYYLLDARGKEIQSGQLTGESTTIKLDALRPGLYFIRVPAENGRSELLRVIRQ